MKPLIKKKKKNLKKKKKNILQKKKTSDMISQNTDIAHN